MRLLLPFLLLCPVACASAPDPFPRAVSKKGLQVELVDDAIALGVKHAALNLNLTAFADLKGDPANPSWSVDGRVFRFRRDALDRMDRQIRSLSDAGMLVYLIVLAYASPDAEVNRLVLHPRYDPKAPNHLGGFNTADEEGRLWFTAVLEFLADRWSRADGAHGRGVGWILGNEINSHWFWYNLGRITLEEFTDEYLKAARLAHAALRRRSPGARLYLSLEHHWGIRYPGGDERQAFPGRAFLDLFARKAREGGDFDWHLAFHPYPENLFEPRFWNDRSAQPREDTPRITFKNLEVLTAYLRRPELLWNGAPRRVILSEQGFHTPAGPEGEMIQAAAYCAAYKKVEALEGIDAFILHRHVDSDREGGLLLGLRRRTPGGVETRARKRIYDCFRLAYTPEWERAFEFALPVVGVRSW